MVATMKKPSLANSTALNSPIPLDAPVTTAIFDDIKKLLWFYEDTSVSLAQVGHILFFWNVFRAKASSDLMQTFFWALRFSSEGFALALGSRGTALTKNSPSCALAFGRAELFIFNSFSGTDKSVP